ncbi:MAG: hypothetical protein JOZ55_08845 [Alphaproteobacteria bacterium]|nr:hypothetical protein [Alphaproteobacteria bacterium]
MRTAIGRIFDSLGVVLAAVLTLCGFLLLFMPWKQALSAQLRAPARTGSGEVFVTVAPETPAKPH